MLNRRILFLTAVMVAVVGTVAVGGAVASDASSYDQAPTNTADYGSLSDVQAEMDGNGSESDPYVVTDPYDLQAINASLDSHYVLGNDINASGTENWNSGSGFDPLGGWDSANSKASASFTGTFDGNGYTIEGLTIDRSNQPAGLFLSISGTQDITEVSDLTVKNFNVTGTSVGGITGVSSGDFRVEQLNIDIEGTASGDLASGDFAGVVGKFTGEMSAHSVTVSDISQSSNTAVGGLSGEGELLNHVSNITVGDISSTNGAAGIAVYPNEVNNISDITVGDVSGDSNVGGVAAAGITDGISDVKVGDVSGAGDYVGGVLAYPADITNISNITVGDVSGATNVGGVSGNPSTTTNISNITVGDVSGATNVGGVAGYPDPVSNISDITVGDVSASGSYVGGVAGRMNYDINHISDITIRDISGDSNVGGVAGDSKIIADISDVKVENISGTNQVGAVAGISDDNKNITRFVVKSMEATGTVNSNITSNNGGDISNSIIFSESGVLKSSSTANDSVIFAGGIDGQMIDSYTNSSYYDENGDTTQIDSFVGADAMGSWSRNPGNLETTAPVVPELGLVAQFDIFGAPEITSDSVEITIESGSPGEQVTGAVRIDTGVDTPIEFPVTVEMSPDEYERVSQEVVEIDGTEEYDFSFNTTERDFGSHTMVVTVGVSEFTQDFELTESDLIGGSSDDTTFSSFDIPGTDISVPLLPVSGILVIGALGVGYVYYREEEIDFQ